MKQCGVLLIVLVELLLSGIVIAGEIKPPLYIFLHNDVGTIANYILLQGVERGIRFHEASDKKALKALNCLDPSIFLPNSSKENRNIILEGKLHPGVFKTPGAHNMLQPEEYQYFTLNKWYIRVPFIENTTFSDDHVPGEEPVPLVRYSLKESDFNCDVETDKEDMLLFKEGLSGKIEQ